MYNHNDRQTAEYRTKQRIINYYILTTTYAVLDVGKNVVTIWLELIVVIESKTHKLHVSQAQYIIAISYWETAWWSVPNIYTHILMLLLINRFVDR